MKNTESPPHHNLERMSFGRRKIAEGCHSEVIVGAVADESHYAGRGGVLVVSKYSHDPRCSLGSSGICQIQLTSKLFDFLYRAGRDGLDLSWGEQDAVRRASATLAAPCTTASRSTVGRGMLNALVMRCRQSIDAGALAKS